MNNIDKTRIIDILRKNLEFPMKLEVFYGLLDEEWEKDPLIDLILENVESAIEHAPSSLFNSNVDLIEYRKMYEYKVMEIDLNLFIEYHRFTNQDQMILFERQKRIRKII